MKISIITITYNRAHLIEETIESVLNQTYPNFEHIIIDDGSTDNTEEIIKNFEDERIKYFKLKKTGNLNILRNYGFKLATGTIYAILDSDDLWVNDKLEIIIKKLKSNPKIKFITHNISYFENINNIKPPYYKIKNDFFKNILNEVLLFEILPFPNYVFRKEILEDIGKLNESLYESLQDFLFKAACNYKIYFISKSLTYMRIHSNNTHTNKKAYRYFTDYYWSITHLLFKQKISFVLYLKGILLNSKKILKYLIKKN